MRFRFSRLAAVATVALVLTGCGAKLPPNASPVAKVSVAGRQFLIAAKAAVEGIDQVITAELLPRDQGVQVLAILERAGEESVRLADILLVIAETREATVGQDSYTEAAQIVTGIQRLIDEAVVPIADGKLKTIVRAALGSARALLLDLASQIAAVTPGEIDDLREFGETLRTYARQSLATI
jgi:predicted small lipoprotein YifL